MRSAVSMRKFMPDSVCVMCCCAVCMRSSMPGQTINPDHKYLNADGKVRLTVEKECDRLNEQVLADGLYPQATAESLFEFKAKFLVCRCLVIHFLCQRCSSSDPGLYCLVAFLICLYHFTMSLPASTSLPIRCCVCVRVCVSCPLMYAVCCVLCCMLCCALCCALCDVLCPRCAHCACIVRAFCVSCVCCVCCMCMCICVYVCVPCVPFVLFVPFVCRAACVLCACMRVYVECVGCGCWLGCLYVFQLL